MPDRPGAIGAAVRGMASGVGISVGAGADAAKGPGSGASGGVKAGGDTKGAGEANAGGTGERASKAAIACGDGGIGGSGGVPKPGPGIAAPGVPPISSFNQSSGTFCGAEGRTSGGEKACAWAGT
jgi:hypothetical protein